MTIHQLFLYPVKSLGAVAVQEAIVEERGFRYDRRFMLVEPQTDEQGHTYGKMMTQRAHTDMALMEVAFGENETVRIWHRHQPDNVLTVPLAPPITGKMLTVSVWDSADFEAQLVGEEADAWFSQTLRTDCRFVYMPDTVERAVSSRYRQPVDQTDTPVVSFADGFPYLLASLESLAELNRRLAEPVGMGRFRPNIVVAEAEGPHDEDTWAHFRVGSIDFFGVKPCARCVMTTIDPQTAQKGKEPMKTLATYRQANQKILFGQNVLAASGSVGTVRVGDTIEVFERMEAWL